MFAANNTYLIDKIEDYQQPGAGTMFLLAEFKQSLSALEAKVDNIETSMQAANIPIVNQRRRALQTQEELMAMISSQQG